MGLFYDLHDEVKAKLRISPKRFKGLVIRSIESLNYSEKIAGVEKEKNYDFLKDLAAHNYLPIFDEKCSLLWHLDITGLDLQEIGVGNLRVLCKEIGFERLKTMSIDEIKQL